MHLINEEKGQRMVQKVLFVKRIFKYLRRSTQQICPLKRLPSRYLHQELLLIQYHSDFTSRTSVLPASVLELKTEAQKIKYWLGSCLRKQIQYPSTGHENPERYISLGTINSRNQVLTSLEEEG